MEYKNYSITAGKRLYDCEFDALRNLEGICNKYEGLKLRLNWGVLTTRLPDEANDFLCMDKNGMLVGYLGVDGCGGPEIEITGMVHPGHRRMGIFSSLLKSALGQFAEKGMTDAVLVNESISASGAAFIKTLNAIPDRSEHRMELQEFRHAQAGKARARVIKADRSDIPFLARLDAACFGLSEDETIKFYEPSRLNKNDTLYKAVLDDEDIGMFKLHNDGRDVMIFGFGVLPEYRGRGLGREILNNAIGLALEQCPEKVALEVDCSNETALSLYKSCGFGIITTYDYFRLRK